MPVCNCCLAQVWNGQKDSANCILHWCGTSQHILLRKLMLHSSQPSACTQAHSKCCIQRTSPNQRHGVAWFTCTCQGYDQTVQILTAGQLSFVSLSLTSPTERRIHLPRTAPLHQSTAPLHRTTSDHELTNPHLASPPASSLPSHHRRAHTQEQGLRARTGMIPLSFLEPQNLPTKFRFKSPSKQTSNCLHHNLRMLHRILVRPEHDFLLAIVFR